MAEEVTIKITAQDNFSGVLGNFGNIITGIRSAISLAADAFRMFSDFALEGLDAIASYERLTATMETLVAKELLATGAASDMADALSQSGTKAEELLKWVQELAIRSPFSQEGVADAFRTALAYGFSADEAQRLTEAMIDFASGSGATEGVMNQIALALGQIEAKGKLAGQEVLQLVNAGLPVNDILASAFNTTTAEVVEMREKGLIPAQDAIEAIVSYLETNFAGAAERQAETWAGLMNTFGDIKEMGLREFFGGLYEALQPIAVELSNWLQGDGLEKLREWGEELGNFTAVVVDIAIKIKETFSGDTDVWNLFIQSFQDIDWSIISDNIIAGLDNVDWGAAGQKMAVKMRQAVNVALEQLGEVDWGPMFGKIFTSITDFLAGYWAEILGIQPATFEEAMGQWKFSFEQLWIRIKSFLGISSPSTVFFDIGKNIIQGLINGVLSLGAALFDAFKSVVAMALEPLAPLLDLLGIDITSLTATSASGLSTAALTGAGTATPGTATLGSQTVNNNYYGPVYFMGAGEPGAYYDCPSPNPFMTSGSGLLVTN